MAAVVLAIGGLAVADEDRADRQAGGDPTQGSPGESAPSPEAGRSAEVVGPARGADVRAYVEDRTSALLESPDEVDTAVVSFSDRLSPEDALAVVGDAGTVRAVLYRLPLEQAAPEILRVGEGEDPGPVLQTSLEQQTQVLEQERASAIELLESGTVEDEEFEADYQRRVEELDAALAAVDDGRVVHAVVLRAPLAALQGLVDATAVRLVDPAPPGTDVSLSVFHGLLPADTETTSFGRAP